MESRIKILRGKKRNHTGDFSSGIRDYTADAQ